MIESFEIIKISGDKKELAADEVVREISLRIDVDGNELAVLLCSPSDIGDLVIGFLFTSGMIKAAGDIKKIVVDEERWTARVDLAVPIMTKDLVPKGIIYGVKIASVFKIKVSMINMLAVDFQKKSGIYLKTGGAHSAGLADEQGIIIFKEDIGRHNTVDKVIGCRLKEGKGFENKILISSGRVSSEILFKVQKAGIPILVSQSAPTNQAVNLARDMGITLIGFARGNRMNIYSKNDSFTIKN